MHEAAFAYWPGTIDGNTRSAEVVSSLDLVPTLSALAGVALPTDRVYDGRDMSHILLDHTGTAKSLHDFLFFYGGCSQDGPSAARHGQFKVGYRATLAALKFVTMLVALISQTQGYRVLYNSTIARYITDMPTPALTTRGFSLGVLVHGGWPRCLPKPNRTIQ
jgi:arylsulfatase A-like enzyme